MSGQLLPGLGPRFSEFVRYLLSDDDIQSYSLAGYIDTRNAYGRIVSKRDDIYVQMLLANSSISYVNRILDKRPGAAAVLSTGHGERKHSIARGQVDNESLLTLACAKGYDHVQSDSKLHRFFRYFSCTPRIGHVIDKLLDLHRRGVDIKLNQQDTLGNTALHVACLHRDSSLIQKLIAAGADLTIRNHHGDTPLGILQNTSHYNREEATAILAQYTGNNDQSLARGRHYTFSMSYGCTWRWKRSTCISIMKVALSKRAVPMPTDPLLPAARSAWINGNGISETKAEPTA